ncbi:MAG: hypothetical protein NDF55_04255 [archaeon GB-1867-005]|nr:hypothetical protein [Candidatus Culexmicrobium cathedralense]
MAKVAIMTRDPRIYYIISRLLKEHSIDFVSITPGLAVPNDIKVVLTSRGEAKCDDRKTVITVTEENAEESIFKVICALKGKTMFDNLIIGIDPGAKLGFAALADGTPIALKVFYSTDKLVEFLTKLLSMCPARRRIIRIGSGGDKYLHTILARLREIILPPKTHLELVSESLPMSPYIKQYPLPSDVKAACNIALSRGAPINRLEVSGHEGGVSKI